MRTTAIVNHEYKNLFDSHRAGYFDRMCKDTHITSPNTNADKHRRSNPDTNSDPNSDTNSDPDPDINPNPDADPNARACV